MIDPAAPAERSALAAEYVLGTLGDDDHAAVVAALRGDVALRAEVYAWQDRLLPLSRHAAPLAPRPQLWQRIDAALNAQAAAPAPPPSPRPAAARAPWWQGLRLWQGVSALAIAASLLLSALLLLRTTEPAGTRYVALLQSPDGRTTGWVVELQSGGKLRLVPTAAAGPAPAGRALQFWTKPEGAAGPTSLGLVRAGQTVELPVSRLPAVGAQQLFEITLEPEAGSPLDRPTGPILFVGRSVAL